MNYLRALKAIGVVFVFAIAMAVAGSMTVALMAVLGAVTVGYVVLAVLFLLLVVLVYIIMDEQKPEADDEQD